MRHAYGLGEDRSGIDRLRIDFEEKASLRQRQRRVRQELVAEGACSRVTSRGVTYLRPPAALQKKCLSEKVKKRVACELAAEKLLAHLVREVEMPARREKSQAQLFYRDHSSPFSLRRFQLAHKALQVTEEVVQQQFGAAMQKCRER